MTLRERPETGQRVRLTVPRPGDSRLAYAGLKVLRLEPGDVEAIAPVPGREQALVVIEGQLELEGYGIVASRFSVFSKTPATVLYLPPGDGITLKALTSLELVVASAPSTDGGYPRRLILPSEVKTEVRGSEVTERLIHHLMEEPGQAERLLLVEVFTPPGHWSSFPPHKHDEERPPTEAMLEELYYYRVDPPERWALQRVYRPGELDEAIAAGDGDAVLVPRGYHPVSAPPGASVYYLNVMAGPKRAWHFTVDPDFSDVPGFSPPSLSPDK